MRQDKSLLAAFRGCSTNGQCGSAAGCELVEVSCPATGSVAPGEAASGFVGEVGVDHVERDIAALDLDLTDGAARLVAERRAKAHRAAVEQQGELCRRVDSAI